MKLLLLFFCYLSFSFSASAQLHPDDENQSFFYLKSGQSIIEQYRFEALNKLETSYLMIGYVRVVDHELLNGNLFRFTAKVTRTEEGFWLGEGHIFVAFNDDPSMGPHCKYPIAVASIRDGQKTRRTYVRTAPEISISKNRIDGCPKDKVYTELQADWSAPAWFQY